MIGKQRKMIDAVETKYWPVEHIQELTMEIKRIMSQKKNVLENMQEITEGLESLVLQPLPSDPQEDLATYLNQLEKLDTELDPRRSPALSPRPSISLHRHTSGSPAAAQPSMSPSVRRRIVSRMSERELRAFALFNLKKLRAEALSPLPPFPPPSENEYPDVIPPLLGDREHRKLRRQGSQRRTPYSKSDPMESYERLDTQISFSQQPYQHKRNSSFGLQHSEKLKDSEDSKHNNSCILDYVMVRASPSCRMIVHSRALSDHTTETSTACVIPKNYRYSIKDFKFLAPVNSGSFGKICLVEMISTGEKYAMKIINSEEAIATNREDYVESEWNVFRQVNSDYIVRCYYTFYYAKFLCFVMEYLNGGDLSFFLKEYTLSEKVLVPQEWE